MEYYLPTKIILGKLESELKSAIGLFKPQKILLASCQSMKKLGAIDKILNLLSDYEVSVFSEITQKPSLELVQQIKKETDLVIGLGGGSVLDTVKVAAAEIQRPLIAIPTTAGSGSEVTPFAALYDMENKKKLSLTPGFPSVALFDYRLTLTLPQEQVASTGLDALSQAVEAYWSIYSNPLSDTHAQRAIELVMENLENSWKGQEKAREMMSLAALEAGLAFSQTKTTAVHSVSYPFSIFYDIPHGFACALTLPYFFVYNAGVTENDCLDKRGVEFVKDRMQNLAHFLGAKNVKKAKEKILGLMASIKAPTKVDFDIDTIVRDGFSPERVANNPRNLVKESLEEILKPIKK
jgi:alcohol dehydrogenase class IV